MRATWRRLLSWWRRTDPPLRRSAPSDDDWPSAWRGYDRATGARPDSVPTLALATDDGRPRHVRFDGIDGDYLIDRKLRVVDLPRSRTQLARQHEALERARLTATWEVPSEAERALAAAMLARAGARRIKLRVVRP
ncbi:hypothetical protein [Sphingomonas sp. BK580]|uniref:hypothetical protein n=1 Tax=Sphingomonas sp. BK580 TaxID=2586972 RepID=UPI0016093825|nr:hypothetical protein [Sphingomonas sp. BK580]MBB3695273.1 hypothetical protein [Sphingomonas sp. BK580]